MTAKELGEFGENLACGYLVKKGFKILGRNYRITFGELDIIARKKSLFFASRQPIHFVEVKAIIASGDFFPEDRVDERKQRKLRQLAQIWLKSHGFKPDHPHQIDVIGITVNETTRNANLRYVGNAVTDLT
jgi:putative endonuclease